jgi:hypothetical protein
MGSMRDGQGHLTWRGGSDSGGNDHAVMRVHRVMRPVCKWHASTHKMANGDMVAEQQPVAGTTPRPQVAAYNNTPLHIIAHPCGGFTELTNTCKASLQERDNSVLTRIARAARLPLVGNPSPPKHETFIALRSLRPVQSEKQRECGGCR